MQDCCQNFRRYYIKYLIKIRLEGGGEGKVNNQPFFNS